LNLQGIGKMQNLTQYEMRAIVAALKETNHASPPVKLASSFRRSDSADELRDPTKNPKSHQE
jgi:hypothetical protein